VSPIYKKNDASEPLNYRPISLTCVSCKVMETVIRDELMQYFDKHGLIANAQHGFRAKKSVSTQLLECQNSWFKTLCRGFALDVVYIDFAKAFDTVCHSKLLHKLAALGVSGRLLSWLQAFLSCRSQRVLVNDALSDSVEVTSSVVQGSVLGPTLFLAYVNDIVDCVKDLPVKMKLFADDVKLYATVDNATGLQTALDNVSKWSEEWQLSIASSKCCVLGLGAKNPEHMYQLAGDTISRQNTCRDLGVQLTSSNKSSEHCSIIAAKAIRRAGMILRAFATNTPDILIKAFTVFVRPLLECATPTWSPYLLKDIDAIERVQRYYTRRVFKRCRLPAASYPDRLKYFEMESLELRRIRSDLTMYFKIIHGYSVIDSSIMFQLCNNANRGNGYKMYIPFCNTVCLQNAFPVRQLSIWNGLSRHVVSSKSVNMFLSRLKSVNLAKYCRRETVSEHH